jgi:hypothetical protein
MRSSHLMMVPSAFASAIYSQSRFMLNPNLAFGNEQKGDILLNVLVKCVLRKFHYASACKKKMHDKKLKSASGFSHFITSRKGATTADFGFIFRLFPS